VLRREPAQPELVLTDAEKAWIQLSHHVDQLDQFLAEAPAEIARRRAAGDDVTWMVDAVAQLQAIVPCIHDLVAEHRVIETLEELPGGLQFDELATRSGLSPDRLTAVLRQLEDNGLLGPGPHSR